MQKLLTFLMVSLIFLHYGFMLYVFIGSAFGFITGGSEAIQIWWC